MRRITSLYLAGPDQWFADAEAHSRRKHELCAAAISLIMLDARIAGCVQRAQEHWPARVPRAALFGHTLLLIARKS